MRLLRISLAVKYRILFGLAVILILAAALAVPWTLLAALIYEQPFREAQRAASDHFLLLHAQGGTPLSRRADLELLPLSTQRGPEYLSTAMVLDREDELPFAARALTTFSRNPKREFLWETRSSATTQGFHYAHAVRVQGTCLDCHEAGRSARTPYQEGQLAGVITVELPTQTSAQLVLYHRLWLIGAGVLAGILAILVFYFITHQFILSPIHELRGVAERVAEGDLDTRSALRTGDEFEQLSSGLNAMLEKLRGSQNELRRANRLLDEKLGQVAETNVALYEANKLKSEFLANVSHELRTPLTSIIGFAELLREAPGVDASSKSARYAENILISGRILLEIINDLLDLAKIEAGKVELKLETVPVEEFCQTLVEFLRPQADRKQIDLACDCAPQLPLLITDRGRLRQILLNLLSNALKFTPEAGRIRLTADRIDAQHVRLAVTDSGPGISAENQGVLFQKFRQIDQSATREAGGTGLGLAIAKELTELLGGEIGVQSTPGQGATFWLALPTATPETTRRTTPVSLV